jgi:hypothetical protein
MGMRGSISWQMNIFMLREILYEETYDKSPSDFSKIREKGGGERNLPKRIVRNPPNFALGRLSWAADSEVPPAHTLLNFEHGRCSPTKFIPTLISLPPEQRERGCMNNFITFCDFQTNKVNSLKIKLPRQKTTDDLIYGSDS